MLLSDDRFIAKRRGEGAMVSSTSSGAPGARTLKWIWAMAAAPVLATVAFLAIDARRDAPRPAPERSRAPEQANSTLSPPPQVPVPRILSTKAAVSTRRDDPQVAAVTAENEPKTEFDGLGARWNGERPDQEWTFDVERDLSTALTSMRMSPNVVRDADCRETLCRISIDGDPAAGFVIQAMFDRNGQTYSYMEDRSDGDTQYLAFVTRKSGKDIASK
jgi:hypothetical protein